MTRDHHGRDDHEVVFIGKIASGTSHEFMNVLATIRESSGLIEDLLAMDDTPFPFRGKLSRTLRTIRGQVDRGMEVGGRLNRFAHSMDSRAVRLEVNELLRQIASLMQRLAGLRQVEVRVEGAETPVEIETDPVRLQMVLAACIEYCLDRTAGGGVINLECRRRREGIAVLCTGSPVLSAAENPGFPSYCDVLDEFRDHLSTLGSQGATGLELRVPSLFPSG